MQEFISFLNQGWVGTIIGTAGLALALLIYWRSRISGIIAFQSRNVSMIGGGDAVFPAEVEVRYRGAPVPGITSSTVWIWNAGKKTVRGTEIVAHDPLELRFRGEVLNVRIRKVSRQVLRIIADTSGEGRRTVCCGFEFLDPGDGCIVEVLHTGPDEAPECTGTIIGLPKGPQYWGHAWGSSASSRRETRFYRLMLTVVLVLGLGMSVDVILGEHYFVDPIEETLPFLAEYALPSWLLVLGRGLFVLFGLLASSFLAFAVWSLRHRSPSSLDLD